MARATLPLASKLTGKLRRARALSLTDWKDLILVSGALFQARLVFGRLSAKRLVERLQSRNAPGRNQSPPDPKTTKRLQRLEWLISTAATNLPWRTDCLIRCIVADRLVRRLGLVPEFFIGVRKEPNGDLAAHAWIRCQGVPVAGGDGAGFVPLIGRQKN